MSHVHLGFKAFDIHELTCHFVARTAGLYAAHGLEVRLVDTSFIPDEKLPPRTFSAAGGAALMGWLKGAPWKVVFVASERPMFWLWARPDIQGIADLRDCAVASYPSPAPPAQFLKLVLANGGLDADSDIHQLAARDDTARVGMLADGSVRGAVVSSAYLPAHLNQRGFHELAYFGDLLELPTTGLAVQQDFLDQDRGLIERMCLCHQQALNLIHQDADVLQSSLIEAIGLSAEDAVLAGQLVRSAYSRDGTCPITELDEATQRVRAVMGLPPTRNRESVYDFSCLEAAA